MAENREKAEIRNLPLISVVIPARNEERYLPRCLDSILSQDYPQEKIEIIVVDGLSTDKTAQIASDYGKKHPQIKVLTNPKKTAPTGLNMGVREAHGEIIARVDSHGWLKTDYLSKCLNYLTKSGAQNVGGPVIHIGENLLGQAVALASRTRFGLGGGEIQTLSKGRVCGYTLSWFLLEKNNRRAWLL